MNARKFLADYAKVSQPIRAQLLDELKERAGRVSPINLEMVEVLEEFSEGSKEVRGALTILGYRCAGQEMNQEIITAGVAVDFIHSALLIADDVMDQGGLRRGKPTVHQLYQNQFAAKYQRDDTQHFGIAMAFNLSLMAIFYAEEVLVQRETDINQLSNALPFLNRYLIETTFGQGLDVTRQKNLCASEAEILAIHQLKTARYTIAGPLQLGGILGEAKETQLDAMRQYGEKVGVAFQLRDDELGLFGDEQTIGKSVLSDLREGKNTLLFVKAYEKANASQRQTLEEVFGSPNAIEEQLEKVRKIVNETGALELSQKVSQELIEEGKSYVPAIADQEDLQETLYNLADFMVARER